MSVPKILAARVRDAVRNYAHEIEYLAGGWDSQRDRELASERASESKREIDIALDELVRTATSGEAAVKAQAAELVRLRSERDAARAELARVTAERDALAEPILARSHELARVERERDEAIRDEHLSVQARNEMARRLNAIRTIACDVVRLWRERDQGSAVWRAQMTEALDKMARADAEELWATKI